MPLRMLPRIAPTPLVISMNRPCALARIFGSLWRLDEQRTGNVEEVERHAVDDARQHDHPQTGAGIAVREQAEAQDPGSMLITITVLMPKRSGRTGWRG